MSSIAMTSPVLTFVDPTKGSMTNRAECAKEHFKNNLSTNLKAGLIGVGAGVVVVKPSIATKLGTGISKLAKATGLGKFAAKVAKNPKAFGVAGLAIAGGMALLKLVQDHAYKAGQIDQKYTDSAAIESQTKNVILA